MSKLCVTNAKNKPSAVVYDAAAANELNFSKFKQRTEINILS